MTKDAENTAWIFVSHASADLKNVRRVRNYLESKDAAPLLFHLMALTDPEEFWPIIEREIQARNFFLYCESPAAEESHWVRREREAVGAARRGQPKRIGRIRVDGPEIDAPSLDDFLSKTRVFPSFSHKDRAAVAPFLAALKSVGFGVFEHLTSIQPGALFEAGIEQELRSAAEKGWIVAFLSAFSMQSPWVQREIQFAMQLGAKFLPVLLDNITLPPQLATLHAFDAHARPATAPADLANLLLDRP
jgi:hypothetical protein